jgi:esterase/lipase superfamily enzyme
MVENYCLVLEFENAEQMRIIMENSANNYEGYIPNRIGYNIPRNYLKGEIEGLKNYHKYVISYIRGDYKTRCHELCHAKFYCDDKYRKKWMKKWNSLNTNDRRKIEKKLKFMGYPENVCVDEYQAYSQDKSGVL